MAKDQELLQAVKVNDTATVRKILAKIYSAKSKKGSKSKYNLNFQDEDGFTALHHASLTGNTEIVMALLDMQCNVNARDKKGMSPLHLSAWAGKAEIAKLLIQARSCVNLCSDSGETPLHLACQHCNVGVVEVLLEANVDATVINKNGESALDLACRFGHIHVVDLLLRCKDSEKLLALYDENQRSADPPLHISCKTGREEIVIMLLEAGADINQSGANGTALHEAALYGKTDVVKILLDHGADVSITNEEGYTPLDLVEQFTSSRASADIKNLLRDASKNRKVTAKALRDYCNVYDPTCLSFKTGDVIEIIEQNESGRWKGKIFVGKKETIGYFPASMVKLANPRRQSMRSSSIMRDSAVPPIGKYEMVALASASHPLGPRPRMSSFGKSNKKARVRSPREETGEECLSPQSPSKHPEPAPIANGLQDSELFRNQQSLQYVEVSVDRSHPSPASPSHGPMSPRTQYAEVVLAPSENGVSELEEGIDAPRLPMKLKGHDSNDGESSGMGGEPGNDIWVQRGEPEGSRLHPMTEGEKGEAVVRPRLPTPIHAQNQNDVRDPTRRDSKSSRTSQQSLGEASKHFEENDEVVVEPFEVSLKPASATSSSRSPPEPFELRKALPKHESPSPPSRVPPQPETAPKPFSNITPPEVRPSLPGTPPETKTKPPLAPYPPKTSPKTTPKPHIPPAPSRPPPQLPPEASKAVPTRLAAGSGSPARIHSPELSRKGYEDMNLSPTKEEPDHSLPQRGMPPRMLDFREHLNTGLSTPERRQPLAYENVEVKASRGKTVPQSMLITEVDQGENNEEYVTVNRGVSPTPPEYGTPLKPCYENVHQEFEGSSSASDISYEPMGEDKRDYESMSEKTKNADSVQGPRTVKATNLDDVQAALDYESMGTRGPLSEYEPVSESGTVMRKVVRGSEAKGGPGKSYENVAIKSSHATEPTSPGYMNMNDPDSPLSPSNDYININVPTGK